MKIERPLLSQMFTHSLMEYIEENDLKAGDCLPSESALSEMFGISRTSVREGIAMLKSKGLLNSSGRLELQSVRMSDILRPEEVVPYQRFLKLSTEEELELLETRKLLECYAMERALENCQNELLVNLRRLARLMEETVNDDDAFREYDLAFHREILTASHNSILVMLYDFSLSCLYERHFIDFATRPGTMERAVDFHSEIVRKIEENDKDGAIKKLTEHLEYMQAQFKTTDAANTLA